MAAAFAVASRLISSVSCSSMAQAGSPTRAPRWTTALACRNAWTVTVISRRSPGTRAQARPVEEVANALVSVQQRVEDGDLIPLIEQQLDQVEPTNPAPPTTQMRAGCLAGTLPLAVFPLIAPSLSLSGQSRRRSPLLGCAASHRSDLTSRCSGLRRRWPGRPGRLGRHAERDTGAARRFAGSPPPPQGTGSDRLALRAARAGKAAGDWE